jgi:phenylacetate-coenzyme A ligase PaaK-like adenylate-forming protein
MGLGGGVECEAHHGYHLREADLFFEIVHPQTGEPIPDGEYGEVVFTTLTRQGMPFLRYRMGDRSRFLPGACPCGTSLELMERVSGRINEFVPVGDAILNLPDFDEVLFSIPDILNFNVTVLGDSADASVCIEAQMLTSKDRTALVEQALARMPSIQEQKITIRCQHCPDETGSLRKRVIVDQRDRRPD